MKIFISQSVEKFIFSLPKPTRAKVIHLIELLEESKGDLSMPYSKKVASNLFELRVVGHNHIRILYSYHKNGAILLHGFVKKSSKISKKEIDVAIKRLKELD